MRCAWLVFVVVAAIVIPCIWVAYGQEGTPAARGPQWEYATFIEQTGGIIVGGEQWFKTTRKVDWPFPEGGQPKRDAGTVDVLNKIGAVGWELFQVRDGLEDRITGSHRTFYFKRQVR